MRLIKNKLVKSQITAWVLRKHKKAKCGINLDGMKIIVTFVPN